MSRLPSLLALALASAVAVPAAAEDAAPAAAPPVIQVAVLLDTSGSMDGLINQTRQQLWQIVNTLASARRQGQRARLELALYEYGNSQLKAQDQWIRQVVPLTTDLDRVSEALFSLKTDGGDEFCGAVIARAGRELAWSRRPGDLKLIYIAGNEPFTQGPVPYAEAVKGVISRGIVVNTIHAGSEAEGVNGQWAAAARLGDGNYLFIDQNRAVAQVAAPQDAELARLSEELNATYLAYGARGRASAERQKAQDANAAALSPAALSTRAMTKSGRVYRNDDWDLVDAAKAGKKASALSEAELPEALKGLSPAERDAAVEKQAALRQGLQARIAAVAREREAFVQAELKKRATAGARSLDEALLESARVQARAHAFEL